MSDTGAVPLHVLNYYSYYKFPCIQNLRKEDNRISSRSVFRIPVLLCKHRKLGNLGVIYFRIFNSQFLIFTADDPFHIHVRRLYTMH